MWNKFLKLSREKKINLFLIIFFGVGIIGLSLDVTQSLFISLMPFTLLLSMGLMFWVHRSWKPRHMGFFFLIAVLGFAVELAGVATGVVFGEYNYGRALGFKIFGTPPMIGLNWLMLIYAIYAMLRKMPVHPVLQVFFGAGLMVAYDVVMEPVAMQLDMWDWPGGVIPLQNYIAWFVISLVMFSILHFAKLRFRNGVAPWLFFIQFGFFLVLNILIA